MYRLLLVAVLSCIAISGFARKKVYLEARTRFPMPPIEVYIDNRTLEFNVPEDVGRINILIKDVSGNVIFDSFIENQVGVFPIELGLSKGSHIVILSYQNHRVWGNFDIE